MSKPLESEGNHVKRHMVEEVIGESVPEIYDDEDITLDYSIEFMLLAPRAIAALRREGIETIDPLAEMTEAEVPAIKGIGNQGDGL